MSEARSSIAYAVLVLLLAFAVASQAGYSGGTGEPNSPFEIATVVDWQELMEAEGDWDKHFVLTADIDLNDVAITPIAPDVNTIAGFQGTRFTGILNGNGHIVRNVDINMPDANYVGLFGCVGEGGQVAVLGVEDVMICGGNRVGGLAGYVCKGNVLGCYTKGFVAGDEYIGGMIGINSHGSSLAASYSTASVVGNGYYVGGLAGSSSGVILRNCYAAGDVVGEECVGGLLGSGRSWGSVDSVDFCYSLGSVSGGSWVGGVVGYSDQWISFNGCFWDTDTSGLATSPAGGEGKTTEEMQDPNTFLSAGWDFTDEDGDPADWLMGEGEYPQLATLSWIWTTAPDVTGLSLQDATNALSNQGFTLGMTEWVVSETTPPGHIVSQYPTVGVVGARGISEMELVISIASEYADGDGSAEDPYQIAGVAEWGLFTRIDGEWSRGKHFILTADIDFCGATVPAVGRYDDFEGMLDGNGHIVKNIRVRRNYGEFGAGLISHLYSYFRDSCYGRGDCAGIRNLGVENIAVEGYHYVGGLVGHCEWGRISGCYVTGDVSGDSYVGGLVGLSHEGDISNCYTSASVRGDAYVGGLVGHNYTDLFSCYSTGPVSGETDLGGLVGVGYRSNYATCCFWDVDTSGQSVSASGVGKTTEEMKTLGTYVPCWDFTIDDYDPADWVMPANDYPRLVWEYWEMGKVPDVNGMALEEAASAVNGAGFLVGSLTRMASGTIPTGYVAQQFPLPDSNGIEGVTDIDLVLSCPDDFAIGSGTYEDPYRISKVCDWLLLADSSEHWDKEFVLTNDLNFYGGSISDISGGTQPFFEGVFDGNDHAVQNVRINGEVDCPTSLFAWVDTYGRIDNLRVENVVVEGFSVTPVSIAVGGLVGRNDGSIRDCHVSGRIEGNRSGYAWCVGGLVGVNHGSLTDCSACCWVGNGNNVGGLVGHNGGDIVTCYADASILGRVGRVGALAGDNRGSTIVSVRIADCFAVVDLYAGEGAIFAGGLVGRNERAIDSCYAVGSLGDEGDVGGLVGLNDGGVVTAGFWDIEASGLIGSEGGEGKTTAEMQDPNTFISAGWDFVGESANGTRDVWAICEGMNYPRLVWQIPQADWACPDGVGFEDFGYFGGYWGTANGEAVNLDGEDGIGFGDLMIFCEEWLVGR